MLQRKTWIFVCILVLSGARQIWAQAPVGPPFCSFQQISDPRIGNAYPSAMSADGTRIVFVSTNSTTSDTTTTFFLLDTGIDTLTQIASFTESRLRRFQVSPARISTDGSRITFTSQGNLTGQNADGNPEVFLFTVATSTLIQITNTTTGGHSISSLNANGSRLVIISYTDPTEENPYGNPEILRFDVNTGVLTPVIRPPFPFRFSLVSFNADATHLLFSTSANPTGANPDANEEVFLFDAATGVLTQITNTTNGNSFPLAFSPDGTRILIESTADLTGENVKQTFQLFLFDIPTATFSQITHATEGFFDFTPFFSADGTRIIFTSAANLLGNNLDVNEPNSSFASKIFLFDTTMRTLTQITRNGTSPFPAISADGSRMVFSFAPKVVLTFLVGADLLGYNSDVTSSPFLATCTFPNAQSPTIKAAVESPEPGPVSGIAVIRGWAFSTRQNAQIDKVTLLVDGSPIGDAPCCSERTDVSAAFPQFATDQTRVSGWGLAFNWGILSAGPHILRAQIRNTAGELFTTEPILVTAVRPGDFEYLDQFSLAEATAQVQGDELVVENAIVRDKTSQQQNKITARLRWSSASQSLQTVEATTVATVTSSWSSWTTRLATFTARFMGFSVVPSAQAALGTVQSFESPENRRVASGIGVLRGWAFTDIPNQSIKEIRLLIDGQLGGVVPCCTQRGDVAVTYPEIPAALNSGWGLTLNYGNLTDGPHVLDIEIEDSAGTLVTQSRVVTVVKIGGFEFLDLFDLSVASARIVRRHPWGIAGETEEILMEGVRVRDKASQFSKVVAIRFQWSQSSQGFEIEASADGSTP